MTEFVQCARTWNDRHVMLQVGSEALRCPPLAALQPHPHTESTTSLPAGDARRAAASRTQWRSHERRPRRDAGGGPAGVRRAACRRRRATARLEVATGGRSGAHRFRAQKLRLIDTAAAYALLPVSLPHLAAAVRVSKCSPVVVGSLRRRRTRISGRCGAHGLRWACGTVSSQRTTSNTRASSVRPLATAGGGRHVRLMLVSAGGGGSTRIASHPLQRMSSPFSLR